MIHSGIRRVDNLLQGGIPDSASVLLYGPPFMGKETLAQCIATHALNTGMPVVWLTTKAIEDEVQAAIQKCGAKDLKLLRIIDTISRSIDAENDDAVAEFVDSGMDLNGISIAVSRLQAELLAKHPQHLLFIDSLSTLVAYTKAPTVFRFLQILLGRANRAGATSFVLMDEGMHSDAEMKMFKHIMSGSLEFHTQGNAPVIHAEGMNIRGNLGAVEYEFTDSSFDIIGLFSTERIA